MNQLIKTIPTKKVSYEFLKSLNGLLDLTGRELNLLSTFLDLQTSNKNKKIQSLDSTENRKKIMLSTGITKDNLCRYIKGFKDKKIFVTDNKITSINKALVPIVIGGKVVQITFILKLKDDEI